MRVAVIPALDEAGSATCSAKITAGRSHHAHPRLAPDGGGDAHHAFIGAPLDDKGSQDYGAMYVHELLNCTSAAQCAGGFCVDGVCCDSACGGGSTRDCQACSVAAGAASNGLCGPTPGSPTPGSPTYLCSMPGIPTPQRRTWRSPTASPHPTPARHRTARPAQADRTAAAPARRPRPAPETCPGWGSSPSPLAPPATPLIPYSEAPGRPIINRKRSET